MMSLQDTGRIHIAEVSKVLLQWYLFEMMHIHVIIHSYKNRKVLQILIMKF